MIAILPLGRMSPAVLTLAKAERLAAFDEQAPCYEIAVRFGCRLAAVHVASTRHVQPHLSSSSFEVEVSLEFRPEEHPSGLLILQ